MAILVLLNNFMHDFSAAGWLVCTVLLYSLLKQFTTDGKLTELKILPATLKTIITMMNISFIGIILFGIVRTLAYKTYEWNEAAGDSQIDLLIIKHIFLTGVFAFGVTFYFKAKALIKKDNYEK